VNKCTLGLKNINGVAIKGLKGLAIEHVWNEEKIYNVDFN
jgi:hypothetical protein